MNIKSRWWLIGLAVALLLAVLAPLASRFPDGLDRFAEDQEFADKAAEPAFTIVPGYAFPGIENGAAATMIAGILGTLLLFGLAFVLAKLLRSKHEA